MWKRTYDSGREPGSWSPYIWTGAVVIALAAVAWMPWRSPATPVPQTVAGLSSAGWLDAAGAAAPERRVGPASDSGSGLDQLLERAEAVSTAFEAVEGAYDERVAPIERVLLRYRSDPVLARRIAIALVREAQRVGLEPRVLLAVLLVENPWLDPQARSSVGAIGLMQIMPLHRGHWRPCGSDLESVEANICHGAQIFAHYFKRSGGDIERALLRYNGCVNGTNTPNCHRYPYHVYARAGRASLLAWLETETQPSVGGAAAP